MLNLRRRLSRVLNHDLRSGVNVHLRASLNVWIGLNQLYEFYLSDSSEDRRYFHVDKAAHHKESILVDGTGFLIVFQEADRLTIRIDSNQGNSRGRYQKREWFNMLSGNGNATLNNTNQ